MAQETHLTASNLIWPIFVIEGRNRTEPIASMPGVERMSVDLAADAAAQAAELGIGAVAIFPVTPTAKKSDRGDEALVEAEPQAQLVALGLGRLLVQHVVDRIADEAEDQEGEERHREHHPGGVQHPAEQEGEHRPIDRPVTRPLS